MTQSVPDSVVEAMAKAYLNSERNDSDIYGRVGSGIKDAIRAAASLGYHLINMGEKK